MDNLKKEITENIIVLEHDNNIELGGFIRQLQEIYEKTKSKFPDGVVFFNQISYGYSDYDDLQISVKRLETDEELETRQIKVKMAKERKQKNRETYLKRRAREANNKEKEQLKQDMSNLKRLKRMYPHEFM